MPKLRHRVHTHQAKCMQELTQGPAIGKLNQCSAVQGISASDSPPGAAPCIWGSACMQGEAVYTNTGTSLATEVMSSQHPSTISPQHWAQVPAHHRDLLVQNLVDQLLGLCHHLLLHIHRLLHDALHQALLLPTPLLVHRPAAGGGPTAGCSCAAALGRPALESCWLTGVSPRYVASRGRGDLLQAGRVDVSMASWTAMRASL